MLFETYYNLQMFTADKEKVFEVGEGTQQSKITDTQATKKTSNFAYALAEAFHNNWNFLQDPGKRWFCLMVDLISSCWKHFKSSAHVFILLIEFGAFFLEVWG